MEIGVSSERQVLSTTSGAKLEDPVGSQPRAHAPQRLKILLLLDHVQLESQR